MALLLSLTAVPAFASPTPEDSVVLIRTTTTLRTARGSGCVIGDGSWVATAAHVVSVDLGKDRRAVDKTVLVYSTWTGRSYEAKVVKIDPASDIALLRLPMAGLPSVPIESAGAKDAASAKAALDNRPLRLYGFPLAYGEDTIASLAKPLHHDSKLKEIRTRGEVSMCVLAPNPEVQPGWSGGPIVSLDKNALVGVFHSQYRPAASPIGSPAGSVVAHLAELLKSAGADLAGFTQVPAPSVARPANAAELMARQMRSLSWNAVGNWKRAEIEQDEIVKTAGEDALAHAELARLLLAEEKYEPALKEAQAGAKLAPGSVTVNLVLGRARHYNYDFMGAVAALNAALALSPKEAEPQLALAQVYEDNQKVEEAEKVLRTALQDNANEPALLLRLGQILLREKKAEEGLKVMAQAAELCAVDQELAEIPVLYGRELETAGKRREAEQLYRQVTRLDPDNGSAYYYLAQLLFKEARYDDAQIQLERGIQSPRLSDETVQAFRALQIRINEKATAN